mgnify:CR=1 FL=1
MRNIRESIPTATIALAALALAIPAAAQDIKFSLQLPLTCLHFVFVLLALSASTAAQVVTSNPLDDMKAELRQALEASDPATGGLEERLARLGDQAVRAVGATAGRGAGPPASRPRDVRAVHRRLPLRRGRGRGCPVTVWLLLGGTVLLVLVSISEFTGFSKRIRFGSSMVELVCTQSSRSCFSTASSEPASCAKNMSAGEFLPSSASVA